MRHRRRIPIAIAAATAIALTAVATVPLFADTNDGTLVFDGGHVISLRDEITDEHASTTHLDW